jgi:mRNA-degrading endonuclease RelE of RelBE toxin-antitoxin system
MDAIEKALKKLTPQERLRVKEVLVRLMSGKTKGLDIKKLKGRDDVFRVRKGDIRIIYRKQAASLFILLIERRNEQTYS